MAGSWLHATTPSGKLRNNETFCGMIENLGDAYEMAEEMYGMIWWLAAAVASEGGSLRVSRRHILAIIADAEEHYQLGLNDGGVQP